MKLLPRTWEPSEDALLCRQKYNIILARKSVAIPTLEVCYLNSGYGSFKLLTCLGLLMRRSCRSAETNIELEERSLASANFEEYGTLKWSLFHVMACWEDDLHLYHRKARYLQKDSNPNSVCRYGVLKLLLLSAELLSNLSVSSLTYLSTTACGYGVMKLSHPIRSSLRPSIWSVRWLTWNNSKVIFLLPFPFDSSFPKSEPHRLFFSPLHSLFTQ